jgi:hypothetical protein
MFSIKPEGKVKAATFFILLFCFCTYISFAQIRWQNVDPLFQPLPTSVHVYKTTDSLDGKPNIAYYVAADLKDKNLEFTTDTTYQRRLKPSQFYEKNNKPLLVVNCTFFSFATNQSLNVVIKDGKLVGYNIHSIAGRRKDTLTYRHPFGSAIGISKKRKADIAWLFSDSMYRYTYATQYPREAIKDSFPSLSYETFKSATFIFTPHTGLRHTIRKWKMQTAVGGGPVLLQNGDIRITNNEELKFAGKAIEDKHPRTAMGYTKNNKLIILVIEGRNSGKAEGASLTQEAQIFKDLGCQEALNLDGGGSSCLLVNGVETIKPSDKEGQRPVPAVFLIRSQ